MLTGPAARMEQRAARLAAALVGRGLGVKVQLSTAVSVEGTVTSSSGYTSAVGAKVEFLPPVEVNATVSEAETESSGTVDGPTMVQLQLSPLTSSGASVVAKGGDRVTMPDGRKLRVASAEELLPAAGWRLLLEARG
jgi:hypothetical protein